MYIKFFFLILLLWIFQSKGNTQSISDDYCNEFRSLPSQIEKHFDTRFSIISESHKKLAFVLTLFRDSILNISKDPDSYNQLLKYISTNDSVRVIWTANCVKKKNIISQNDFDNMFNRIKLNRPKKKDKKKFPVISTSNPFLFYNNSFCLIGIGFYQTNHTATYGYYLFEKEYNGWIFRKTIFEMVQ